MEQIWQDVAAWIELLAETLRIPTSFLIIEFIGTFAFALSGIRLASAKHFDVFGAWIVGMATAIGGGTLRDIMLGVNPFWMMNEIYFIWCAIAVLFVHIFAKYLVKQENTWFIFDTIGLALFNVVGIEKTLQMGFPMWTAITMGSVTGAAGGVIRDVLINEVPLIFRKEIYALACVAGGIVYSILYTMGFDATINALASSVVVITVRCLAVRFSWHLPIVRGE
ncbi:MAG: trimeric intracellular cation channel family protein [Bacteroidaceae bacterium]|nr:trimeric intracellular cation channel family protein [Bacteroidaceae bacterium]